METLIEKFYALRFSDFADFLSVIGFGLTIYVMLTIRKIKSYYVFQARVPELLKQLSKHTSQLLNSYGKFDESKPEVLLQIAQAEVVLKSLGKKVGKQLNAPIKEVTKRILDYKNYPDKGRLWDIYVELQKVSQEIGQLQEDRKWESNNG